MRIKTKWKFTLGILFIFQWALAIASVFSFWDSYQTNSNFLVLTGFVLLVLCVMAYALALAYRKQFVKDLKATIDADKLKEMPRRLRRKAIRAMDKQK